MQKKKKTLYDLIAMLDMFDDDGQIIPSVTNQISI